MKNYTTKNRIGKVETTNDTLTGRGGISLFVRYLEQINIYDILTRKFGGLRKSNKGVAVWMLFKQVFCFFFDGTSRHLTRFDDLKRDGGYAAAIECSEKDMASSHTVKRFFKSFLFIVSAGVFRAILKEMFIWRLCVDRPRVIELTIDTMVMDNDEAQKRHGVQPTYKKVKGFQPLQIIWKGKIVDAIFRGGKKNGNSGHTVENMIKDLVGLIRNRYTPDAVIVLRLDSGFFDEVNFTAFDSLGIVFIGAGKIYEWTKEEVRQAAGAKGWSIYENDRQMWEYVEFDYRCDTWKRSWRAFYTRPVYEEGQMLLEFARPDNVIITNAGSNPEALKHCAEEERKRLSSPEAIISSHHQRGADELPHRGLKDFGFEQLPFKRFSPNSAFYYCMLIAFFLFETFKEDVLSDVLPITSYATTVRRHALDFAAKIVRSGREIILKVPQAVMEALRIDTLWRRCREAPVLQL